MIDELTRSCYTYGLSSLAHDSAAMMLESHSRQSLGEDVCLLILTFDRTQLHQLGKQTYSGPAQD